MPRDVRIHRGQRVQQLKVGEVGMTSCVVAYDYDVDGGDDAHVGGHGHSGQEGDDLLFLA